LSSAPTLRRPHYLPEEVAPEEWSLPQPGRFPFLNWQLAAYLGCVSFGVLLVALIHPSGDGAWFWYSDMMRHGAKLYGQLHLPLQPLLPLEFSLFQSVFGTHWLQSQFLGIFNVLMFASASFWVSGFIRGSSLQRAVVSCCAFFLTTDFVTFRFDDYHVMSATLVLYSVGCLLTLERFGRRPGYRLLVLLGVLSGLCITNRVNDGAALLGSVILALCFMRRARRVESVVTVAAVAAVTVISVVLATGDTLGAWWENSIVRAAAIKGGTGSIFASTLRLPYETVKRLINADRPTALQGILAVGLVALLAYSYAHLRRKDGKLDLRWLAAGGVLLAIGILARRRVFLNDYTLLFVQFLVLFGLAVCVWAAARVLVPRFPRYWNEHRRDVLVFIPFGQLVSISMSSGKFYPNAFPPMAEFLLVFPIAAPLFLKDWRPRIAYLSLLVILGGSAFAQKLDQPFYWWTYRSAPLTEARVWYRHPEYGSMWIESKELSLIKPVCDTVGTGAQHELLSLPFPYANYFCGIPPWHGYVQTFFDTTSSGTIHELMGELEAHPPQWIFYERQLEVMRRHEVAFHNGQPLAHRDLDKLIMSKVADGRWRIMSAQRNPNPDPHGIPAEWLLIRTR